MLSDAERRLLYWLGRHHWTGEGRMVDAGAFLGGSAAALAAGVEAGGQPRRAGAIVSYDRFIAPAYAMGYPGMEALAEGDSIRPLFEANVAPFGELVTAVEGDVREQRWDGEPIEIAFLDVLKSWETNDVVTAELFPHFIPGHTALVQQDFIHEYLPWINVTMGQLAEFFEPIDFIDWGTAVYFLRRPIPPAVLATAPSALGPDEKLALFDAAVRPLSGDHRGVLECSRAVLLRELGRGSDAAAQLTAAKRRYSGSDRVAAAVEEVATRFEISPTG